MKSSKNNLGSSLGSSFGNITTSRFIYRIVITILFVYVLVHFFELKKTDPIYDLLMSKLISYKIYIIIAILVALAIFYVDNYTGVLLFILIIIPVRCAIIEDFEGNPSTTVANSDMIDLNGDSDSDSDIKLKNQLLGIDDRFKVDEVAKNEILRLIKAQVDFDPYKTKLGKNVIYEIYNKYFDNDIFIKLKNIDDDSKKYIAAGNFTYIPKPNKADYDITTYQNLSTNIQFGINPIIDGIVNKTRG